MQSCCPVLTWRMLLRAYYVMSRTDVAYAARYSATSQPFTSEKVWSISSCPLLSSPFWYVVRYGRKPARNQSERLRSRYAPC
eukprot:3941401-Rhodomonas_salina.2